MRRGRPAALGRPGETESGEQGPSISYQASCTPALSLYLRGTQPSHSQGTSGFEKLERSGLTFL